ncbi:MAG TPA: ABC transporter permease subunit [Planctomycetota bacterium]|nr:ABC transporter permease subunit [Planctomycetota bacterium]
MRWAVYIAVATFLAVAFVAPVLASLAAGLHVPTLIETVRDPLHREGLVNALAIAVVTTAMTMVIAVPLAWIGARRRFTGMRLAEGLLLAPLILPPFVGALGVAQVFGHYGALNTGLAHLGLIDVAHPPDWLGEHRFVAVCILEALHLYPFLYLTVVTALRRVDLELLEAARALGAAPWRVALRVVLPLVRPGLFAGGAVVFVWSFTELGTPLMLGYERCTPVQIFHGLNELSSSRVPFALVVVMLAVAAGIYWIGRGALGRGALHAGKGASRTAATDVRGWRAVAAWIPFAVVIAAATFPHAAVAALAVAGDWYGSVLPRSWTTAHVEEALAHPLVVPGVLNSLRYAAAATVLGLVVGTAVAWITERWKPPGWRVLDAVAMLPLAVPGIVLAFGYLGLVLGSKTLEAWLSPVRDPTVLLIIAYAVRRLPHVVRSAAAGFQQAPVQLEEAAAALGAGPATRLRRITLPLIAGNLAAGALLTFSFSMLEVADSLVLAQKREFYPVTKVIYELAGVIGAGPSIACAFAVWAMLFLAAALVSANAFLGTRSGSLLRD